MAESNKIRLIKIASEINIGRETIVEFLRAKGFDIDNKPTATLTEEMAELVYDKFKREKKAAEKQREKLQKHKEIHKQIQPKAKIDISAKVEEIPVVEEPVKPIVKDIDKTPKEVQEKAVEPPKVEPEIAKVEETPAIAPKIEPVIKEDKPAPIVAEQLEPHTKQDKFDKSRPAVEKKPTAVEELPESSEPAEIISSPTEIIEKVPEKPKQETSKEDIQAEPSIKKDKKRKKKKKIIEVVDQAQKPSGLKIPGKIDIAPEKPFDKQKDKKKIKEKFIEPAEPIEKIDTAKVELKKDKFKKKIKDFDPDAEEKLGKVKDKKRKKKKKSIRETISEEEVMRAIRETYAGMEPHTGSMRERIRQKKKQERKEKEIRQIEEIERESHILRITEFVTTSDLANMMGKSPNEIILKCMSLGLMVTINQRLDKDTITLIADDYGYEVEFVDTQKVQVEEEDIDPPESLVPRPPIVTIMGHVDHGKTSLLDYIRRSNVVAGEAGGITQHIGAYKVTLPNGREITFLDTPGHEAFTAMRARGAQVTDIVVLVVAADDSVMPQTIEAISHAKAAGVPMIVAINKIDKPDANPDRIKQQLADHGVLIEEWGGKYQHVEISAKKGINIDELLEKILLEADILDLKANPNRKAKGVVIESNVSKGLGPVATIIVQKGTLKIGDPFVSGIHHGRVRAMQDERGNKMDVATPAVPVRVMGFDGLPEAGDNFFVVDSEAEARSISNERKQLKREQEMRRVRHLSLDEISSRIKLGSVQELNLIIKGDVGGSVEAISDSLLKLSTDEVRVNILHQGVGEISESDVMLAAASQAIIIGFNVSPSSAARRLADNEKIDIRLYNIIYDCINEVQMALEGLLKPEIKEEVTAEVEVRRIFKISRIGTIAGCYVLSGKISRNDRVKVLRNGLPIFNGTIASLKRNKDDVKEVDTSYECGIQLDGFNDIQEGDIIQGYKLVEIRRNL
ncbi:MAG TPA: translation initiation factor IF-2 [Candidatus Kapabacteria bacterium]|nr:translation initiation factor IF-2 [Candidatus Kapabacteria bacterium]